MNLKSFSRKYILDNIEVSVKRISSLVHILEADSMDPTFLITESEMSRIIVDLANSSFLPLSQQIQYEG